MSDMKYRTITLTDRAPVRINEQEWLEIASAKDWDNTYECQANRTWTLRVRQHRDGRTIVYGVFTSQYQGERGAAGGEILTPPAHADIRSDEWYVWDAIPEAIKRVAARCGCERIADQCIADLPAQDMAESAPSPRWVVMPQAGGWLAVCEHYGITTQADTLEALGPMMADALRLSAEH